MASVRTDNAASKNAPYTFTLEAYGVFNVTGAADEAAEQQALLSNGFPLLMGALREHLAQPWGRFLINTIPLQPPTQINYI
jgi:hypothetical protein